MNLGVKYAIRISPAKTPRNFILILITMKSGGHVMIVINPIPQNLFWGSMKEWFTKAKIFSKKCDICHKYPRNSSELWKHKRRIRHDCKLCGKDFSKSSNLHIHLWDIHKTVNFIIFCSILHHKSLNGFPVYAFLTERCSIALELSNRLNIFIVGYTHDEVSSTIAHHPKRIRTLKNLSQVTMLFTQNGLIWKKSEWGEEYHRFFITYRYTAVQNWRK